MAVTVTESEPQSATSAEREKVPPLEPGDRLTRAEFERRYEAMPELKKAELVEGIVYMPSPVSKRHGKPHLTIATWLGSYEAHTPGVETFSDTTDRLDEDNEPQPDLLLRILPELGGQSRDRQDDEFIEGPPELAVEIAASSASYDLHAKKNAYRRNGVREYLVLLVRENSFIWWRLQGGEYVEIEANGGLLKSRVFPGLWLDAKALLGGNIKGVLDALRKGIDSPEHAAFCGALKEARLK